MGLNHSPEDLHHIHVYAMCYFWTALQLNHLPWKVDCKQNNNNYYKKRN